MIKAYYTYEVSYYIESYHTQINFLYQHHKFERIYFVTIITGMHINITNLKEFIVTIITGMQFYLK